MATSIITSEDLWRDCANWLTRCDVLRSDHRANWPTAGIVDLANILRDGVLLCNLLNILDPGCIDFKDVNQKPQMAQFLCLRNIQTFLHTCKDIFGIKENDLFDPAMLFDLTNFHRVLCTLSKLSNCPKALKKFSPGFSAHKNGSKEDIYQSLQAIDSAIHHYHHNDWNNEEDETEYASYYSRMKNEEIYQDLCSARQTNASPPVEKRDHVIKELLDTEKNYVEVLKKLKTHFKRPLNYVLNAEHINIIFKDIPELLEIHVGFYMDLGNFYKGNKPELSKIFLDWREKFLIYGSYCANLTDAQATLQEICDRDELANQEVIKCQLEANNGKFKLRDVLSVPMQRILKYHLLLQKLIEETPHNHEEYNNLKRAREAMVDVACFINEVKRDSDHLALLKQVKDNISEWHIPMDYPLQHYGRLIKDGELKIKSHDDQKIHSRYVFIFDKVIILCKQMRGNQFTFKDLLPLNDFYIEDVMTRAVLNREARWSHQFLLVKKNRETVYTLLARSLDIKRKMIKAIQEALDNINPPAFRNTNHKFELTTFESPVICRRCSKFLKGLIYQGYRCRQCSVAVHKDCLAQCGQCTPLSHTPAAQPTHHDQLDDLIREHLWFAGEMKREDATQTLEGRNVGTYLLRVRPERQGDDSRYALSLKTIDSVRHMRVFKKMMDNQLAYYLSESRFFKNVLDLVEFYEHTSLRENYERLEENAKLQWPYRQLRCRVENSYEPLEPSQIPLVQGCQVMVYKKEGAYWKGRFGNQVGFFPRQCVKVIEEVTRDLSE